MKGKKDAVARGIPSRSRTGLPTESHKNINELGRPHVESFNYALTDGLADAVRRIPVQEAVFPGHSRELQYWVSRAHVGLPTKSDGSADHRKFPSECRERGMTYDAPLTLTICHQVDGGQVVSMEKKVGDIPIMVRSKFCHLHGLNPKQLVERHEEPCEFGGYFICNGNERVVRMLQIPRRNHMLAIERGSFPKRGPLYSTKAIQMRCARTDQTSVTLTLHYLTDGSAMLRFSLKKQEFFLPVVMALKAFKETSDREIYEKVLGGDRKNPFVSDRLQLILQDAKRYGVHRREAVLSYLGSRFRTVLAMPPSFTNIQAGQYLLDQYIFVHLEDNNVSKFELLIMMMRKLYAFAAGNIAADNPDSLQNHELLLSGHLYLMFLKERIEEFLKGIRDVVVREVRMKRCSDPYDAGYFKKCMDKQMDIGKKVYYLLATGNLDSNTGLDQMQVSGYAVVADKINWLRFLTHFRSVHRGQFFSEMKTTSVRKLLPDGWGFLCPVHTPDGAPCGLLNHITSHCQLVTHNTDASKVPELLVSLGMTPLPAMGMGIPSDYMPVMLDGKLLGGAPTAVIVRITKALHRLKAESMRRSRQSEGLHGKIKLADGTTGSTSNSKNFYMGLPPSLEVAFMPPSTYLRTEDAKAVRRAGEGGSTAGGDEEMKTASSADEASGDDEPDLDIDHSVMAGPFPGLYLFSQAARMVRSVKQLDTGLPELIGPMEQTYMDIACRPNDIHEISPLSTTPGYTGHQYTHIEHSPMRMLSLAASLTPFSDMNQSPRNMYQCQMGKQTMGTPCHALSHRVDTKLYRIQTPQAPLVMNENQKVYGMDEYAAGTNAVVAVIAYTGFDMEDAMIINKSSYERGFGHGSVHKTKVVDLRRDLRANDPPKEVFANPRIQRKHRREAPEAGAGEPVAEGDESMEAVEEEVVEELRCPTLGEDGLPPIGLKVQDGDALCCVLNLETRKFRVVTHHDSEPAYVEEVRLLGSDEQNGRLQKVSIKLRYNRNPVAGDKFSSRHGQKGVLSFLWPQENLPFTESGMSPDVIINPHAFPSRMTIGMLCESMAGKAGALHGHFQDSTPFRFGEEQRAIDYFGEQLKQAGYAYYGSEPLYSGTNGTVLHADIFIGVVYYQRLRHMVSDKSQVRAEGPINNLTRQPVKGRKKGGGIRLGEMERDSLLAHGCAFLLRDRLMNSSDRHLAAVCQKCGSMLSPVASVPKLETTPGVDAAADATPAAAATHSSSTSANDPPSYTCLVCNSKASVKQLRLPYVLRYLANELAGMNIKMTLQVE